MRGRPIAIIVVVLVVVFAGVAHGTYQWGFNTGNTKGYQTGYTKGDTDGQNVGYYKGFNEGQQKGYTNGQAAVEKQANGLAIRLQSMLATLRTSGDRKQHF
jgi:flagellar biosynthesis/type III secretory pathway protein FliH